MTAVTKDLRAVYWRDASEAFARMIERRVETVTQAFANLFPELRPEDHKRLGEKYVECELNHVARANYLGRMPE